MPMGPIEAQLTFQPESPPPTPRTVRILNFTLRERTIPLTMASWEMSSALARLSSLYHWSLINHLLDIVPGEWSSLRGPGAQLREVNPLVNPPPSRHLHIDIPPPPSVVVPIVAIFDDSSSDEDMWDTRDSARPSSSSRTPDNNNQQAENPPQ